MKNVGIKILDLIIENSIVWLALYFKNGYLEINKENEAECYTPTKQRSVSCTEKKIFAKLFNSYK